MRAWKITWIIRLYSPSYCLSSHSSFPVLFPSSLFLPHLFLSTLPNFDLLYLSLIYSFNLLISYFFVVCFSFCCLCELPSLLPSSLLSLYTSFIALSLPHFLLWVLPHFLSFRGNPDSDSSTQMHSQLFLFHTDPFVFFTHLKHSTLNYLL